MACPTPHGLEAGRAFRTVMRAPDGTEYPTQGCLPEVREVDWGALVPYPPRPPRS